jgi:iron(III) transport system permease protein
MPTVAALLHAQRRPPLFDAVMLGLVIGVAALVIYPLISILGAAFLPGGKPNLGVFARALAQPGLLEVMLNTVVLVLASGILALALGSFFAWLNERTDARLGWVTDTLPLIPLLVPNIAGVIGWVMLLAPQAGLLNVLLRSGLAAIGIDVRTGPFNIYSWTALILIMGLYFVPYSFLVVSAALRNLDPNLEEASRVHGGSPARTLWKVTLPAVRPALLAAGLIMVIAGFAQFSVPIVIGTGAKIDILSVRIYRLLYSYPPRTDLAIVLSLFMLAIVQVALLLQGAISKTGRFAVIGGKGTRTSTVRLGAFRWLARFVMIAYVALTTVLPVAGLLIVSLQRLWMPRIAWDKLSLANYQHILVENTMTSSALLNSVVLGAVGATVALVASAMMSLYFKTKSPALRRFSHFVVALPAAIPHTVIGVGFVVAFSSGWLNIHGTFALLFLVYFVMFLPQAERSASAAFDQVGNELSEASRVFGASQFRTFWKILLPLMLSGLVAGWIIVFVQMAGELTASALLSGASNPVIGLVLLDLWENGSFPQLAAMAMVVTMIDVVIVTAVLRSVAGGVGARQ